MDTSIVCTLPPKKSPGRGWEKGVDKAKKKQLHRGAEDSQIFAVIMVLTVEAQ